MSKYHGTFTENFTISFSNAGKTGNGPEFEFEKFEKTVFWRWYNCNISSIQIGGIRKFCPPGAHFGLGVLGHFGLKNWDKKNCQNL